MTRRKGRVLARHYQIKELRGRGLLLKQIALALGYADHTTVSYHLHRCRCEKE